ncbi:hypothetical protein JXD38_03020 [candidate division WOR-3 bacterium]|nr:hypothetical protein [candidate division WOR-3 bacterium]
MRCFAAVVLLLAVAGVALADVPEPQQQVLVQFSVGTGTTLVGLRVLRQAVPVSLGLTHAPGRFCLRLPFGCAMVMENAAPDGSGVVVRPQFGPIAFEVAVGPAQPARS